MAIFLRFKGIITMYTYVPTQTSLLFWLALSITNEIGIERKRFVANIMVYRIYIEMTVVLLVYLRATLIPLLSVGGVHVIWGKPVARNMLYIC